MSDSVVLKPKTNLHTERGMSAAVLTRGLEKREQARNGGSIIEGEAQLAKAESTRRVRVLEAQAEKDGSHLRAEAEVIRAGGVARANKVLAESLGGAEGYLRWKYINMLEESGRHGRETIYIPTEATMPILEAGRFGHVPRDVKP